MSQVLRTFFKFNSRNFKLARYYSANTSIKSQTQEQEVYERDEKPKAKGPVKPAAPMPLAKNFFLGTAEKQLLAFPEVIEREDLNTLKLEIAPIQDYFNNCEKDHSSVASSKDLELSRDLGLFGLNVPKDFEGRGYEWTASLMASEPESNHFDLALRLLPHRMIIDLLKDFGSEEQKAYFLPKMANGSFIGSEALTELSLLENGEFATSIETNHLNNLRFLNGEKPSVRVGPLLGKASENLFLVLASNPEITKSVTNPLSAVLCLVEGSKVQMEESLVESNKTRIKFNNVELDEKNFINKYADSEKITEVMLNSNRLRSSLLALSLAKQITNETSKHFVNNNLSNVPIKDTHFGKIRMGNNFCKTYAMESMIYYTSGLMDEFHQPDVTVETAATKFYALRNLMDMSTTTNDFLTVHDLELKNKLERNFRNLLQLNESESLDALSIFIGMNGLHYAGTLLQDSIRKGRNPLFNPGYVFSKILEGNDFENPKTKLGLHENVHPTLNVTASYIEESIARLLMSVEALLSRHGNEVIERHQDIQRLAIITSELFAMWASISRASRSYCIGLQYSDHEMLTASTICLTGRDKIKSLTQQIMQGPLINSDENFLRLSKHVSKNQGYQAVHPLTFNF